MTCPHCTGSNADTARYCSSCGADFAEITRQSATALQQSTLVDARAESVLNSTIAGKYRIEGKLGAGGMGAVYRATRLVIGDEVALKILHSEQGDPKASERFRREAQAAARLKHPNAVTIHDFGVTDDGLQYLVMELVDGESLRRIIKQQGPVTPSAAGEIINQVCAALDEAHQHGIIHRDVKPDNIIVKVTANGLRVKVLDFGIAKLRDDTASNLTQTGSILGTPHYMSPEQCLGEEIDTRSDIYSVGIVLYEMLTGLVPFNSPTSAAVVVQQVTQPPPSLRSLNPSVPAAVERVVLHALEKQRGARPQTAGELARELTSAVRSPGVSTLGDEARVHDSGLGATLVLNQPSLSGGFGAPRTLERNTPGHNERNKTMRLVGLSVLATVLLLGLGGLAVGVWLSKSNDSTRTAPAEPSAPKNESASASERGRLNQGSTPAPLVRPTILPPVNTPVLRQEVLDTLQGWAGAARTHDLDAQMSFYAATVDPYFLKHNVSAAYVRNSRSVAFSRFTNLDIQLSNISIQLDQAGTLATATFDKAYSFSGEKSLSGSVNSMLWLTKSSGRWLISGEKDLKVYYVNK